MKKALLVAGLLALLVSLGAAQLPVGQHNGLWVGMFNSITGVNHVLTLDNKNAGTAYSTSPSSAWPYWGNPFGACMFWDNDKIVLPAILDNPGANIGIALWDANLPGVSSTLWAGPISGGQLGNWADWTMDSDGQIITIDNSSSPQTVHFYDWQTSTWTKKNLPATTPHSGGILGTKWDRINGGFIWGAWGPPTELYSSRYDFGTTTTLATGPLTTTIGRYGGDLTESGDFYSSTCCSQVYYVVKQGSSSFMPGPAAALNVAYDITTEHMAKKGESIWTCIYNSPGVGHMDLSTTPPTFTRLFTGSATTMPTSPIEVVEMYNNDLNTIRAGRRQWDVNINPGIGMHAGRNFVIAVSLAGASKVPLPDGRELFITPDIATTLSANGLLAPFLTNNLGKLDPFGKAKATLDLTSLGTGANGTVIHFAAVVLDVAAPSGIAHVCQPWAFVINNR